MKSIFGIAFALVLVLLQVSGAFAQTSNVTFVVNTATMPDTIVSTSPIVITGSGAALTNWGAGAALTNVGGDYWKTTLTFPQGDTLNYKIRFGGSGWEENVTGFLANTNRNTKVPTTDTTLAVQFWNNGNFPSGKVIGQFDPPYTPAADSFLSVFVRVNLKAISDQGLYGWTAADQDSVCIMGGGTNPGDLDWGTPFYLTQEKAPSNSPTAFNSDPKSFYSGRIRILKRLVNAGDNVSYKFRLGSNWSYGALQRSEQGLPGDGNRHFTIPVGKKDTTLQWVFFADTRPVARANPDTVRITFRVSLAKAIQSGGFTIGDTLYVRSGYFATAAEQNRRTTITRLAGTTYVGTDTVVTAVGKLLDYQFYAVKNAAEIRENYYNFAYDGPTAVEAEKRQVLVPSKNFTVADTATSVLQARRQPDFPNSRKLLRNVNVKWEVDVRPAYYTVKSGRTLRDVQGADSIYLAVVDSIIKWGVWMNGPAVGGWSNAGSDWGSGLRANLLKKLYDDGTHGDRVAGDSIFTRQVQASPDSLGIGSKWQVGQVFKFGIRGGDNEGGSGGFGNNHGENIKDTDVGDSIYTISSQFGSINPLWYNAWDFDTRQQKTPAGVKELPGLPGEFALSQNYPNPFNPSTKIQYTVPTQSFVTLKVYNVIGQEVATLVNETQKAARYEATLDASKFASGVYMYRLSAGSFVSTRKMLLLK